jgi:hypothetical protein
MQRPDPQNSRLAKMTSKCKIIFDFDVAIVICTFIASRALT